MDLQSIGKGISSEALTNPKFVGALDALTYAGWALVIAGALAAVYFATKVL